jgi:hypothetical protein
MRGGKELCTILSWDLSALGLWPDKFRCGFCGFHMTSVLIVTELGLKDLFIKDIGCSYPWDTNCSEIVFSSRSHRYNAVFWYMTPCRLIKISSQSRLSRFHLVFFTRTYSRVWLSLWFLFEDCWKEVQIGALDSWFESSPAWDQLMTEADGIQKLSNCVKNGTMEEVQKNSLRLFSDKHCLCKRGSDFLIPTSLFRNTPDCM